MAFEYKNQRLEKYGDIIDKALSLEGKEQEDFVDAFAKAGPYALENIGYWSGYYSREMSAKIQEVFKTSHPIFGRTQPTAEQAFEMGKTLGQENLKP